MNYHLLVIIVLGLLFISIGLIVSNYVEREEIQMEEEKEYQGAVPEGYDLEHFRRTGETIKLKQ